MPSAYSQSFWRVPILVDQGRVLCQSNAILSYLAQQSGQFTGNEERQAVLAACRT
ncbi:glutathione S-transferase N-terminal domain-containing protein [Iodobacter fluviatilis]|uniref:GST N-terminal domain-containing protein n=1 Tax=Iodobacter fluviatilis TaxID=537 RepID=A0A7G3GDS8_9NEIS|nr:hypothetical protein C1H71_15260 [Iodobacter fluviatilis]